MEEWKDVLGYEGLYQVSSEGRVKSLDHVVHTENGRGGVSTRMSPGSLRYLEQGRHGYILISLYKDNKRCARSVHSLVAEVFLGKTEKTVNHIDGNKANNRVENLEWVSYSDNHIHAVKIGLNLQAFSVIASHCETGEEMRFPSLAQAAFVLRGSRSFSASLSRALKHKRPLYGYYWRRAA